MPSLLLMVMLPWTLRSRMLLALPPLEPFRTELAYLYYPEGGRYLRHMDVPSAALRPSDCQPPCADGGSFSGAATRREISVLLYLNSPWDRDWGGEFR